MNQDCKFSLFVHTSYMRYLSERQILNKYHCRITINQIIAETIIIFNKSIS